MAGLGGSSDLSAATGRSQVRGAASILTKTSPGPSRRSGARRPAGCSLRLPTRHAVSIAVAVANLRGQLARLHDL
jgi:hypothetical protein